MIKPAWGIIPGRKENIMKKYYAIMQADNDESSFTPIGGFVSLAAAVECCTENELTDEAYNICLWSEDSDGETLCEAEYTVAGEKK